MAANRDTDKTDTVAVELRLDRIPRLYNSLDPAQIGRASCRERV